MSECYIYKDSNCYKSSLFAVARRAQDCIEESHFLHGHAVFIHEIEERVWYWN